MKRRFTNQQLRGAAFAARAKAGFPVLYALALLVGISWADLSASSAAEATGDRGMVATVHPLATEAGLLVLREGGNAIDAAVTAALVLGVVDGHNSGIGGGCFILVRAGDGKLAAIDGRETAPARAFREMYFRDGQPRSALSQTGALAIATPGALAAYDLALRSHGRKTLADALSPAAKIAEDGFTVDALYAARLASSASELRMFEGSRGSLLKSDGGPYTAGETMRQPELARTYRSIAEGGVKWFYNGPFARAAAQWTAANGGLLTAEDFTSYRAVSREPLITSYRDCSIVGFPPPSSGGVHVAQMLNILEQFDVAAMKGPVGQDPISPELAHLVAETMKRAFADRAYWLGDADHVSVPRGLIDKRYAQELASQIDPRQATPAERGQPPRAADDRFPAQAPEKHTTHIAAVDDAGNWVAITATINTTFGSKVVVPGTGVVMNNEMDDFAIAPGVANAFGLVGSDANAIAPGKRPLSSMSPTIVLRDGEPVIALGAAGGPKIISQVLLVLLRHLDLGQSLEEAVAAPRLHHQWSPDVLYLESGKKTPWPEELRRFGHEVRDSAAAGVCQAIGRDRRGKLVGVSDPRVCGKAAGW